MKAKEKFEALHKEKKEFFNLKMRLTLAVGAEVVVSIIMAFGVSSLFRYFFPNFSRSIPIIIQINLFSMLVAVFATQVISRVFFDPISDLREAMKKIADGKFDTRMTTKSTSNEVQEVVAGFNMMAQELEATEILQSDFVSNVSHEFKTPINAIEGYATLLQGYEGLDEEERQYVDKIIFNTRRLSTLVGNILLLSKLDNQSIQTNCTEFSLDEQIRNSVVALEDAWLKKDVEFDVELEEINYTGNESILHHVWDNLIGNAIKFGPQAGVVTLRLFRKDGKAVFSVDDQGPGLSEQSQKHIFDKFYQEDSSHKSEGNGLGLALAKRIVSNFGGVISAQNLDTGCRFTVELPLK